jgi:hypothetical protein
MFFKLKFVGPTNAYIPGLGPNADWEGESEEEYQRRIATGWWVPFETVEEKKQDAEHVAETGDAPAPVEEISPSPTGVEEPEGQPTRRKAKS